MNVHVKAYSIANCQELSSVHFRWSKWYHSYCHFLDYNLLWPALYTVHEVLIKCRPFFMEFFQVPMTVCTLYTVYNSCPGRLCEEIGQNVRKDDSCKSTLAIYMNYLSTQEERKIFHIATILCLFFGLSPFSYTYVCIGSVVSWNQPAFLDYVIIACSLQTSHSSGLHVP